MKTKTAMMTGTVLTLGAILYALALWPSLPARVPTHWDMAGRVDAYGDKLWAAFALPGVMALLVAMMPALPRLSPRGFAVEPFRETFNYLLLVTVALFGYLHIVTMQAALHPGFDFGRVMIAGLFLFLAVMGNVMGKVRRNFWMGVRTPWTLASDAVWIATHRLAARLLVAGGLAGAIALWLGAPVAACFALLIVAALIPAIYSLLLYKRLEREGRV